MTSIAIAHKESIIEQVANGVKLRDIAANLGVSKQALSKVLTDDPDYQAAQVEFHRSRLDEAEQGILDAREQVDVARASHYWRAVSFRAEREQARIWGSKQELTVNHQVSITAALEEARARVIEGTCHQEE